MFLIYGKYATIIFLVFCQHWRVKRKETHTRVQEDIKAFGKRLRELRVSKGVSMQELADLSDIEYSQISRIERGIINTGLGTILIIAKSLDVHPRDFFDF